MAGARVRDSVIGPDARVGRDAVVDGSIVGRGGRVEAGAKVTGLSMLGDGAVAVSGAILDGVKIPEVE